jgi:hypothetical protein
VREADGRDAVEERNRRWDGTAFADELRELERDVEVERVGQTCGRRGKQSVSDPARARGRSREAVGY